LDLYNKYTQAFKLAFKSSPAIKTQLFKLTTHYRSRPANEHMNGTRN